MEQEPSDKALAARWRLTIYLLLAVLGAITLNAAEELSIKPKDKTPAERWGEMPILQSSPWIEVERVNSPDGRFDAVLLKKQRSEHSPLNLYSLRVIPANDLVPQEPPYRHLSIFLMRVMRESIFAAAQIENANISWTTSRKILVTAESADFFSQETRKAVQLSGESKLIEADYSIAKINFKRKP
jgi:hypothetical protein